MDIRKTAWLICLNVFLLHSLMRCNLTTSQNNISSSSYKNALTTSLNVTSNTSLNDTSTTPLYNTSTTSLNDTATKSLNVTSTTSLHDTSTTSVNNISTTSLDNTPSTSLNDTSTTPQNGRSTTSLDNTPSTSLNDTSTTPQNGRSTTSQDNTPSTSLNDTSTTPQNGRSTTSLDNTPSTSLNDTSTTPQNGRSTTSLDSSPSTSLNDTSTTPQNGRSTMSRKTLNTTSGSNHSDLWLVEKYQQLLDQPTNEAKKLFYVSSPEQDSFSLQFKLATDQIYFLDYNVSQVCSKHVTNISEGIHRGDLWALAFLDSNGQQSNFKSINNVKIYGSLEQCEKIDVFVSDDDVIKGKHITMSFLTSFGNKTPIELSISWYFCLPSSCTADDYATIAKTFEGAFGVYDIDIYISQLKESPKDHWYWLAILTLSTLAFICLLATGLDCLYTYRQTQYNLDKQISLKQQEEEENIIHVTNKDDVMKGKLSKCSGSK